VSDAQRPAQRLALAQVARDLLDSLQDGGLHTAAELAEHTGRSPVSVWRSLSVLAGADLVVRQHAESRGCPTRQPNRYQISAAGLDALRERERPRLRGAA
jgi:predicted transcriptional regulator